MPFTPFSYEQHKQFLLNTLRVKLPDVDLSSGSFWQIWAQGQARGLAGLTTSLKNLETRILPDHAVGVELDHHAEVYDLPRIQPRSAGGTVTATAVLPLISDLPAEWTETDSPLHLRDLDNRPYDLLNPEQLRVSLSGLFDLDVMARDKGEITNQVPDTKLYFHVTLETGTAVTLKEWREIALGVTADGLESEVSVKEPGLSGGVDLESDPVLSDRIVSILAKGRLTDTVDDYRDWVLSNRAQAKIESGQYTGPTLLDQVENAYVYQDEEVRNRVYVMALNPAPDRIVSGGFLQDIFNAVESNAPVSVDMITPEVREEGIDALIKVDPRIQARWDWMGTKKVVNTDKFRSTDRKLYMRRDDDHDGAAGLNAGMRIMVEGELRVIGHIDMSEEFSSAADNHDIIYLTEDLSIMPSDGAIVYPGSDVTKQVQEAVKRLFDSIGPFHKCILPSHGEQNIIKSVMIDAIMELEDIHDVEIMSLEGTQDPVDEPLLNDTLLSDPAYIQGLLAYLAVPGNITVVPMERNYSL